MKWQKASFEMSCGAVSQLGEPDLPEIVFSGKSNVGKSSLINKLLERKSLAKTSSEPGKTRTINLFNIDNTVRFVDLPGYGYARVPKSIKEQWGRLMDGFWASERDIKLVIQLIDLRNGPTADDMMMLNFLKYHGYNYIIAATKADKLKKTEKEKKLAALEALDELKGRKIVPFSVYGEDGRNIIREIITETVS